MPSIDMELFVRRQRDIELAVRLSSPVLVWSSDSGIYLIAANKSRTRNRTYKVIDRLACVTRGEINAGSLFTRAVIQVAYALAAQRSIGDVHAHEIVAAVGPLVAERFHHFSVAPMKTEAVIVKLLESIEQDHLSFTNFKGESREIGPVFLMGTVNRDSLDRDQEEQDQATLHDQLNAAWSADATLHDMLDRFAALPLLTETRAKSLSVAFQESKRLEIAMLDRAALQARSFDKIFKRISV